MLELTSDGPKDVNDLYEVNGSCGLPKYNYMPAMVKFVGTNHVSETLRSITALCIHVVLLSPLLRYVY